jgi:hypothetical protein
VTKVNINSFRYNYNLLVFICNSSIETLERQHKLFFIHIVSLKIQNIHVMRMYFYDRGRKFVFSTTHSRFNLLLGVVCYLLFFQRKYVTNMEISIRHCIDFRNMKEARGKERREKEHGIGEQMRQNGIRQSCINTRLCMLVCACCFLCASECVYVRSLNWLRLSEFGGQISSGISFALLTFLVSRPLPHYPPCAPRQLFRSLASLHLSLFFRIAKYICKYVEMRTDAGHFGASQSTRRRRQKRTQISLKASCTRARHPRLE